MGNEDAFRRKVTWALADIGGPSAKQILAELEKSSDEQLAEYAQKRLDSWESELHRKGIK